MLERLGRIDQLRRAGVPADVMLEELRELLQEAEAWSRIEGGADAREAVSGLRVALTRDVLAEVVAV